MLRQLLDKAAALRRGASASEGDRAEVEQLIQELESRNPTRDPLKSPLINGRWKLEYTTSSSILGTGRPPFLRPSGPIYQILGRCWLPTLVLQSVVPNPSSAAPTAVDSFMQQLWILWQIQLLPAAGCRCAQRQSSKQRDCSFFQPGKLPDESRCQSAHTLSKLGMYSQLDYLSSGSQRSRSCS